MITVNGVGMGYRFLNTAVAQRALLSFSTLKLMLYFIITKKIVYFIIA